MKVSIDAYIKRWSRPDDIVQLPDFRKLWLSSVINGFGGQISSLALPLCAVVWLHATPSQMGRLMAAGALPFALFGLPSGVLLDRSRKLPILLFFEILYASALSSIALAFWFDCLSISWMYVVGFLMGVGQVVGGSAEQLFLTQTVGRERLVEAQARMGSTESLSRLIGPGVAGILIQAFGAPLAVLVNAAGFVASYFNLRTVQSPDPKPVRKDEHPLRQMLEGFRFVWSEPLLRSLAWSAACWHILFYGYGALQVLFATRDLGMSAGMLGAMQMLGAFGVLLSSLSMKPLSQRIGVGGTILTGVGCTAIGIAGVVFIPEAAPGNALPIAISFGAANFILDCGGALFFMPYLALRQRITPDAMLGRMTATMRFLTVAVAPIGSLMAGALAEMLSVRTSIAILAIGVVALTLAMVFLSSLRSVR